MSIAIGIVFAVVCLIVLIACWRKAGREDIADVMLDAFSVPPVDESVGVVPEKPEPVQLSEGNLRPQPVDESKVVVPQSLVDVTASNSSNPDEAANAWENCKTVELSPKPIEELEASQAVTPVEPPKIKKKATKSPAKPRKTQLERIDEAIAKLEGQIGRRSTLLKQLKKPVTKDERLNKWKQSLKDLKDARKYLVKSLSQTAPKAKKTSTKKKK